MRTGASALRRAGFAAMLACLSPLMLAPAPAQAQTSEIRYVVNNEAITSYDIQRRAAFLRLQNKRGNLQAMAAEEMIDQAVRNAEARRLNIRVADSQVNEAYERFSRTNRMSPAQMDNILNQAGVTKTHFRDFIRAQIGWSQVLSRNSRAGAQMTEQDVVRRMLEQGGSKPTAREYMLQQVIFVLPASERGKIGARKREAEALRQRFRSCDSTREFAKGLIDVTVRDLGRVLEPELPPDWEKQVKATSAGAATGVRETERGVEFIGVCSTREVSDDRVAQMVFGMEQQQGVDSDSDKASEKLTQELRGKAQIVRR